MSELSREQVEDMRSYNPNEEGPLTPTGIARWQEICDLALRALGPSPEPEGLCLGTEQFAILSLSSLGNGECPICHQQVRLSPSGITYAHLAPRATEQAKSDEQHVLDAMCHATGYQRWWINSGKLFFECDGEPGRIEVLMVTKAATDPLPPAPSTSEPKEK